MTKEEAITAIKTWEGCMKKTYSGNEFAMEFVDAAATLCRDAEIGVNKMTIQEAIKHCEDVSKTVGCDCAAEHLQLADWLKELMYRREIQLMYLGWHDAKTEKPMDRGDKLVAISDCDGIIRFAVMKYNDHKLPNSDKAIGWGYGETVCNFDFEQNTVIAWIDIPKVGLVEK